MFMLRDRMPSRQDRLSFQQRLMPAIMEPPKVITCPDCGDRYDNDRKRRLIDTCGHPRCYSCLFVDKPCPLCSKIPQARSPTHSDHQQDVDETTEKNAQATKKKGLSGKKSLSGSHPNLSEITGKQRSATLPHSGFRADNYFRSLYRYDPHNSQEYLHSLNVKPRVEAVPNYHKSLDNLTEQFWQSVERAGGTRSTSPANSDDANEAPRPPLSPRPRSHTNLSVSKAENRHSLPLREEAILRLRSEGLMTSRSRSHSDLQPIRTSGKSSGAERAANRRDKTRSCSPTQSTQSLSDRSSDVSIPFSDSWSESSGDSDHPTQRGSSKRWSYDEAQQNEVQPPRTFEVHGDTGNKKGFKTPFDGVIYWVVEPSNHSSEARRAESPVQGTSGSRNDRQACAHGSVKPAKVTSL